MKNFAILSFIFLIGCSGNIYPWEKGTSLEQALARAENKLILLDFYSDNWGGCVRLDAETFTNNDVIEFSKKHFISLKYDAWYDSTGKELFSNYNGHGIPLLVFINSKGEEVDRIVGFKPHDEYLSFINNVVDGKSTYLDLYNKFKSGERSESILEVLSDKSDIMKNDDLSYDIYSFINQNKNDFSSDLIEKSEFFFASKEEGEKMIMLLNKFISNHPKSLKAMDAYSTMIDYYKSIQDTLNEVNIYTKMISKNLQNMWILNGYSWRMSQIEKNLDDALEKAKIAVNLAKSDPISCAMILDTQAEVLWKLKRYSEAVDIINRAIELDPTSDYYTEQKDKFLLYLKN